ncbi:MAG TPA: hypothetical protein VGN01_13070, partial [Acidobacteriaceae bacterium]
MTPQGQAKLKNPRIANSAPFRPRRAVLHFLLTFTSAATLALAQNPVETTPSAAGQPQYTIRARVPLTVVDVTVTDAKGHPVHGLQQSDFTLLEDNQRMHPNSFEEHRSDQSPATPPTPLNLPPNTFTNAAPAVPNAAPIN